MEHPIKAGMEAIMVGPIRDGIREVIMVGPIRDGIMEAIMADPIRDGIIIDAFIIIFCLTFHITSTYYIAYQCLPHAA